MNHPAAEKLLTVMEEQIAYFAMIVSEYGNVEFEPELRASKKIVDWLRSGESSPDVIADEINFLEDHYNGIGWSGFVHSVTEYFAVFGEEWEVDLWVDEDNNHSFVILPKAARLDPAGCDVQSLMNHLHEVVLPLYQHLSQGHPRFKESYPLAKEIADQIQRGDSPLVDLDDSDTFFRLGGPVSQSFLDIACAFHAAQ